MRLEHKAHETVCSAAPRDEGFDVVAWFAMTDDKQARCITETWYG